MRGVVRWLGIFTVVALATAGTATASSPRAGAMRVMPLTGGGGNFASIGAGLSTPTVNNVTFAGYLTQQTGSASGSVTFKVPPLTCTATDSGIAPGAFVNGTSTFNGATVLVQCLGGSPSIVPALVVDSVQTSYTALPVHVGDVMQASYSVGAGGTDVTIANLNAKRAFTQSEHGNTTSAAFEYTGTDTVVDSIGNTLPITGIGPVSYTSATIGGVAMGTLSLSKYVLVSGCQTLLLPSAFDSTTHENFRVSTPKINVTSFSPDAAKTGTSITINGGGFLNPTTVTFTGATGVSVVPGSTSSLQVAVPNKAITGTVKLKDANGSITSACTFSVQPNITSFSPASGITGSTVTINGSGLKPGGKVTFGNLTAKVTSATQNQLKVIVPNGAVAAPITVTTPAGTASSTGNFTPTMAITSFSPTSGPHGTSVSIKGVGFNDTLPVVKFGGVQATTVTKLSSTQLKAVVPAGAGTGPITVTNTTNAPVGTVSSAKNFTLTADVVPSISSFTPTSGSVGTSVTITGSHFSGASKITFNGVKATVFHIVSDSEITATVPTGATTGPIAVTNAIGTGTSASDFTVT